jgi:uncharacterized phage protein gp47/JayE
MTPIPTLQQIYNGILSDLQTELGVVISLIGRVFLRAMAAVQAGKLKLLYLTLGIIQKNIWPDTADPEALGGTLERFGRVKLGRNPFPAVAGQYDIDVTGTIGGIIKAGTTFKSNDDSAHPGILYVVDNDFTLASSPDTVTVRALTAGDAGQLNNLDGLTATAPIALVDALAFVSAEVVQPLEAETTEAYRQAVLNSFRLEAQGGAGADYRIWSADAQGVKTVYPYAKTGQPCELDLFIEATVVDSIDGKGTPSATTISDVETVVEFNPDTTLLLNERGRRPISAFNIDFQAVTPYDVDINIPGGSFTAAQKAAITTALEDFINLIRPFVPSCDILSEKNDILDVNKIIGVIINVVPGASFSTPTFEVGGVTYTTYTFINGNIPFPNSVTFI